VLFPEWAERKVRTPQGSVPDNVREAGFKPGRRKVPQKTYRLVVAVSLERLSPDSERRRGKGEKVRQERTAAAVMQRAGQTPHGARPNREEVPASAGARAGPARHHLRVGR
jgi:hypothetical protein